MGALLKAFSGSATLRGWPLGTHESPSSLALGRAISISPIIVPIAECSYGDGEGLPHGIEGVLHDLGLVTDGEAGEKREKCQLVQM